MEIFSESRRKFIKVAALLLASGGLLLRYLTPRTKGTGRALVTCASSDVPVNGALVFQTERLALLRDDRGIYALGLVCTHLGCTVTVTTGELSCPCHGSIFDRLGRVLRGPADRSLPRLKVEERDGRIEVYL
jgi:Rieske Fe-S protein